MAFGIYGFGAAQLATTPVPFQALSLGGASPRVPEPPYGTPNQNLVPVAQTNNPAVPANLTLAALPTYQAVSQVVNQGVLAIGSPPVGTRPNTTTGLAATNTTISYQNQGELPGALPVFGNPPSGPVSFIVQSAGVSAYSATLTTLATANAYSVSRFVQTTQSLAIGAVYPAPLFSLHA